MSGGFKRYFLTGLIVLLPLAASILIVVWLFHLLDSWATPLTQHVFGHPVPGVGFVISLLLILFVGIFSSNVIGRWFLKMMDHLIMDMPVFRTIYNTTKQVMQIFSPSAQGSFRSVVLVENPKTGAYSLGFVTHELDWSSTGKKEPHVAVYVPTNHLYFGDIFLYKADQVHVTNLSVQQGIQTVISAGAIIPPDFSTEAYTKTKTSAREEK